MYLQIHGGMIELIHRRDGSDPSFGITHIAFLTDALDEDYARLTGAGYLGLVAPRTAGTGVGRLAFLQDPNGARVELLERDLQMRVDPPEHDVIRSFDHYSVLAEDVAAALTFYRDDLAMTSLKTLVIPSSGMGIEYLHYDYDVLELLARGPRDGESIFAHVALRVDDVTRAQEVLAARGIEFEPGTPKPAGMGVGSIGIIKDPDGVAIELLDRPDLRDLP